MTRRLAHQISGREAKAQPPEGGGGLFAWNHTDLTQFTVVDPDQAGWAMSFVPANPYEPEHILLTAPGWKHSIGPVYVLVTPDLDVQDVEVKVTHGFFDSSGSHQLGITARHIDSSGFVSARWAVTPNGNPSLGIYVTQGGVDSVVMGDVEPAPRLGAAAVVSSRMVVNKGLVGCGRDRIAAMTIFRPAHGSLLMTDRTVGFGVFSMVKDGSGGGESVKIYDFSVRTA